MTRKPRTTLARRFVAALPREVPMELLPQMVKEYCEEHFVSKGMCCELPKSRKVYDLDENGKRIKLPSGRWKSHKDELTAFNKAYRTLKKHGVDLNVDLKALQKEYDGLRTSHADLKEQLAAVNEELKPMKDIRYWVGKVLSPEQTATKQPEPKQKKQDMEL